MLHRKIEEKIIEYLNSNSNKIMIIDGARQIGKSYIIRYIAKEVLKTKFPNYIELNFVEDSLSERMFADVKNTDDFYFKLSIFAGESMHKKRKYSCFY